MGYTGICWDNAMAESFFATLNTEFYYRRVWPTRAGAKLAVGAWIEDRYNRRRRHSSIRHISPVAFEMRHSNQTAAARQAAQPRVHRPGSRPETLRRQATKPRASEFGEVEMRSWWRDTDPLVGVNEQVIGVESALPGSVDRVLRDCGWTASS